MREIKFRAWDSNFTEMYSWEELDKSDKDGLIHLVDLLNGKEIGVIPMQFTGLKDKNGKEIYEGDIVNVWGQSSNIASVGFLQGCFTLNWNDGSNTDLLGWYSFKRAVASDPKDFEVIGNIYENTELLNPLPTNL